MTNIRDLNVALVRYSTSGDDRSALAGSLEKRVLELRAVERDGVNQSYLDRLQRGHSWLWKACAIRDGADDSDIEARFLFAWIAFNALYGVRRDCLDRIRPRSPESGRPTPGVTDLEWFLWKIGRFEAGRNRIVDFLHHNLTDVKRVVKDPFLVEAYWRWDQESTDRKKRKDLKDVTEPISHRTLDKCLRIVFVWRLRTLRNLFVHGASTNRYSKRRETEEGKKSLGAATRLLERGVACFLAVMEEGDRRGWLPTEGPRAGSPLHGQLASLPEPLAEEWDLFLAVTSERSSKRRS